jgi:hypothetical protein
MNQKTKQTSQLGTSLTLSRTTFKDATRVEAQLGQEQREHKNELEEEDVSEAIIGCDRMVHRTISRTSLPQSRKLKSILQANNNLSAEESSKCGSSYNDLNNLGPQKESMSNENRSPGDEGGEITPTDETAIDEEVIIVDWEGPEDPENPKK